ncbi:MAG TPA: hypothetical protein VNY36_08365 [Bacteroidia bacterium]|jgi:hypothetical protein|nr:hypothetical protein [Bacteroidia bacterium]
MKRLTLILILFLPIMLWSQSMNVPSFKIAKKPQPKAQDTAAPGHRYFTFLLSISSYRGISNTSDLFKTKPDSKEIKNRFDFDFAIPYRITIGATSILFYAQTGTIVCTLTTSNTNVLSIPACGGFIIGRSLSFYAEAGAQFFLKASDPNFSNNVVFDWGAGIGYSSRSLYRMACIRIGYRRLSNINFEGVGIIGVF